MYEAVIDLFANIGLLGIGLLFGVAGMIMGAVRGMTKNQDMWAIGFGMLAWTIAILIPNTIWAGSIFLMGTVGIMLSFMPLINKTEDSNIFALAVLFIILNIIILLGSGAFLQSSQWQYNQDDVREDILNLFQSINSDYGDEIPTSGLCTTIQQQQGTCTPEVETENLDSSFFDVFTSMISIGVFISKGLALAVGVLYAPALIQTLFVNGNPFIYGLMSIVIFLLDGIIVYKIVAFILNKRGMR